MTRYNPVILVISTGPGAIDVEIKALEHFRLPGVTFLTQTVSSTLPTRLKYDVEEWALAMEVRHDIYISRYASIGYNIAIMLQLAMKNGKPVYIYKDDKFIEAKDIVYEINDDVSFWEIR